MIRHFLIIGAQRCGTTYLSSLLDAHPEIAMARPARPEPKVFLSEESIEKDANWYREHYFAHVTTESVLGEKSTSYIECADAPGRAARLLGQIQILVLLRDPVQRAVSNWRFSTANGLERRPLETALRENLAETRSWEKTTSVSPFAYLERGRYADYLEPWYAQFPSSVQVLFLDSLRCDDAVLGGLFASLGVDRSFRPPGRDNVVNESEGSNPVISPDLVQLMRTYFAASDAALIDRLQRQPPWPTQAARGTTTDG